ncbi:MAG: hypothetical protein ACC645_08450, partial [Pirellulales bacterium]
MAILNSNTREQVSQLRPAKVALSPHATETRDDHVHPQRSTIEGLENPGDTLPFGVSYKSVLSGTLADGTPFAFTGMDDGIRDHFSSNAMTLEVVPLPPVGPPLITASTDAVPLGIRHGQTLRVDSGGQVPNNFTAGPDSTVNVEAGGTVGYNFEAVGAEVNSAGGTVGSSFDAFASTVNISAGVVGSFDAFVGSNSVT